MQADSHAYHLQTGATMKLLIFITAITIAIVTTAEPALAQCTTNTIFTPDGHVVTCQTCCYGGNCTSHCF